MPESAEASVVPVPLFRVLQQEYAQIRGEPVPAPSWQLEPDHLAGDVAQLPPELLRLAGGTVDSTKEQLLEVLNGLLEDPAPLSRNRNFPRAALSPGLATLDAQKLGADDRIRVNRLVLEAAFPEHVRKIDTLSLEAHYRKVHEGRGFAALCISGGGIRSATFGLGILQGLARRGLLTTFDYLSTVSGGGYIGGWLSSWIHRRSAADVQDELGRRVASSPLEPEAAPVRNLRAYSNYLTPKLGFLSADTWTLAGIYLCNLLLNWLVFIPLLVALFALPRLGIALLHLDPPRWVGRGVLALGFVAGVLGLAYTMVHRPSNADGRPTRRGLKDSRPSQMQFLLCCLLPLWIAAVCFSTFWVWWNVPADIRDGVLPRINMGWYYLGLGVGLHVVSWLVSRLRVRKFSLREVHEFAVVVLTGLVGGLLLWAAATFASRYVIFHDDGHLLTDDANIMVEVLYVCFAAPAFLGAFLLAATLFVGLVSRFSWDSDREWWARMGAWILLTSTCWAGFGLLTLAGPVLLYKGIAKAGTLLVGGIGGLSGLITLVAGQSTQTAAKKDGEASGGIVSTILNKGLTLTTPIFIAFIVVLLSILSGVLLYSMSRVETLGMSLKLEWGDTAPLTGLFGSTSFLKQLHLPSPVLVAMLIFAGLDLGLGMSLFIDVNKFSIHALYRNRLVRAYLGASNTQRRPDPFTGFDLEDDLPLSDLRGQRPLHIVNMALNLVAGDNLAWQERKAESFTAGPHFCGSSRLGYRPSVSYGRHWTERAARAGKPQGVTLGTAVAISGAAASPNMGYHSSPVVAALMTFFNIRLGWWLGNPGAAGQRSYDTAAPPSGIVYMIKEALGLTNASSRYVYLSDGGHFENLGLYEMVLRRCRLIFVSDAGCDPGYALEDLGNAIRKIRVDQGVEIHLQKFGIYSREDKRGAKIGKYCAIGEIDYSRADGHAGGPTPKGVLVYVKPAVYDDEPKDVYNYKKTSATFPNESTGDQWFSESQFESYRALALHILEKISTILPGDVCPELTPEAVLNRFASQAFRYVELPLPEADKN